MKFGSVLVDDEFWVQADDTLSLYTNEEKDRKRGYALMITVMAVISMMLSLDIWSWYNVASSMMTDEKESPKLNVQWYIPFYGLYFILMGLHVHFAHSAVGLGRRYRRLNMALKNSFQEDIKSHAAHFGGPGIFRVSTVNSNNRKTKDTLTTTELTPSTITTTNQKKMSSGENIINGGGGGRQMMGK
ncbi:unnamed protein product [Hermetia illucens]|uniref:Uncharacterized protein n=1 Tax=Hermetia illucens TaxID=343691 RepID=A0A7R8UTY7_HERIL|nr:unnamed protein product [Hermetia illucens]